MSEPRYVVAEATSNLASAKTQPAIFDLLTETLVSVHAPSEAGAHAAEERVDELNDAWKRAEDRRAARDTNLNATRGHVVKLDKRWAVVGEVNALPDGAGWAYNCFWLTDKLSRLGTETYTTSTPGKALESLGRWNGDLFEGATGSTTINQPKEADMATKVKTKSGAKKGAAKKGAAKPAAKAAKTNGGEKTRRTREDIDALVPAFVEHLTSGGKMKDLKSEYGFSDDGPIRSALFRNGYDAKGNEHDVEADSIDAGKAAGRKQVVKLRAEGAAWYDLAYRTGLTEGEVKKIVADAGGVATGRVYKEAAAKPAATKSSAKTAAKPAAKKSGAKKAKGTKADPS